ncbi:unnamed protein product [Prunus armeniaca]|uniref:Uncharacterized protein n=1 Tax=Prunus armeniaca TaxID=36596 RepID=A0A6J5TFL0_PRUAR|nr:unnamed protein product [Prunus armeniaca]
MSTQREREREKAQDSGKRGSAKAGRFGFCLYATMYSVSYFFSSDFWKLIHYVGAGFRWHATSCNALRWFMLPVTRLGAQWLIIILTLMHIRFTCYLIHPLEQHISFPCYAVIGASFV